MLAVLTVQNDLDDTLANLAGDGELSFREAIEIANNPGTVIDGFISDDLDDTIEFASSFFVAEKVVALVAGELEITNDLTITGPGQELLTIDAGNASPDTFESGFRIFRVSDGDFETLIDVAMSGLSLTGGSPMRGEFDYSYGGAISSLENLTIARSSIYGNSAGRGGGVVSAFGTLTVTDSTISENAVYNDGGGFWSSTGTMNIEDSTVSGNSAQRNGGGIFNEGSLNVTDSTITGNEGRGGGIYSFDGDISIESSTISGNIGLGHGGGVYTLNGSMVVLDSTISGNTALGDGGGFRFKRGGANSKTNVIINSTISANTARRGGGIHSAGDGVIISNSTIFGNTATVTAADGGGGIWSLFLVDIVNSIVAGNTNNNNAFASLNTDAFTMVGGDPLLGPLADNGGPTWTHALLPGSPAINSGDPSIPFLASEHDQRGEGYSRVAFDRIDLGAYEAQTTPSADFDSDGDVDGIDFLAWQRGFGTANAQRADGNSDDDTDTDASDLAAWTVQYGQTGLATLAASSVTSNPMPRNAATPSILLDVVIEWELANQTSEEADDFEATKPMPIEAVFARHSDAVKRYPTASFVAEDFSPSTTVNNSDKPSDPWLDEKLLERVFG